MSDVERWIEQWHTHLAESELLNASNVNELESHIREDIEHLEASGLSDEEAFIVARRRLGDTASLEAEFAKVNTHRLLTSRLWWMIAGVLVYLVAAHFAGVAAQVSLAITRWTSLSPHMLGFIALAVRIGTFCAVGALILWLCARYSQPEVRSRIRVSGRLRLVFLVGLFVETMALFAMGMFAVPYAARTMTPQDYGQIALVQSIGRIAWILAGPVLLGSLLTVIHFAGRQKTETQ